MHLNRQLLRESWHSWVSSDLRTPAGPAWLQWVWTGLFCLALAAAFTLLGFLAFARGNDAWRHVSGWFYWYGRNLVVCLTIGIIIHLLYLAARHVPGLPARVARWAGWQRTLFFTSLPLLGLVVGWPLGVLLAGADVRVWTSSRDGTSIIVGSVGLSLLLTFLMHHYFASKTRQIEAERRASEAQLRLLQGQIEPHFLFNTLANVISLVEHDPPRARQMLETFTDYLRASLGALRHDNATLGTELDLAQAYLGLLKMRMEDRLQVHLDVDASLRDLRLPPLLLQPLIENAVHHGLEPALGGGTVSVSARVAGTALVLEVHDNGCGLHAAPRRAGPGGHGMALQNIRQRLLSRYGSMAGLHIENAHPGTRARITLPLSG